MTSNIKSKDFAKTLLTIWPDLDNYRKILEQKIHTKIIESYSSPDATMQIVEKIIDISVRKDTIRNLSRDLESAAAGLPPTPQTVLRSFYYIKQKTAPKIATEMGISVRSFYRVLDSAVNKFAKRLESIGMNQFTFANLMNTVPWIKSVYLSI
jgi:DNA-directed RNA polymerase specialized sigma subunit